MNLTIDEIRTNLVQGIDALLRYRRMLGAQNVSLLEAERRAILKDNTVVEAILAELG